MDVPEEIKAANERLLKRRQEEGVEPTGLQKLSALSVKTQLSPGIVERAPEQPAVFWPCSECHRQAEVEPTMARHQDFRKYFMCESCRQKSGEEEQAHEKEELEARERERIANIPTELRREGITMDHSVAKLADFPDSTQELCARFMEHPEKYRGLLIVGPTETGKTRLLATLTREYVVKRSEVRFHLARQLFRRIWNTYRDDSRETEQDVIEDLTNTDFLAIDDLSNEGRTTEAVIGALHEIVSVRLGNYMPTAISTNLTPAQITERYGDAIASRLGSYARIVLAGEDRRTKWVSRGSSNAA
ncbi:MAG: ATP-binding protein [Acidobacteria bacterium]|nr:ATP-binding protein [Acidobacteriota bacterium]